MEHGFNGLATLNADLSGFYPITNHLLPIITFIKERN